MSESLKDDQYSRFMQLFVRSQPAVRGFVRSLLPAWGDVDDVMQEVSLACWRKFADFQQDGGSAEFLRWTCMIARLEVLRHRRRFARDRLVLSEEVLELLATDATERLDHAVVERMAVEKCLNELQPPERRLLLSVHTPGDSIAEIATEMQVNARRLYSRLNALRDLIAQCVRKRVAAES